MEFFKKLFKHTPKKEFTNQDFWDWFTKNEKRFFKIINDHDNIEEAFFNQLAPQLDQLREGIFFLTGMFNDNVSELVLTPEGKIKNIDFVEQLINDAPKLARWKFTALKPALDIKNVGIRMSGFHFTGDNMFFYSNDHPDYPDEIDLTIVHEDYNEENKKTIITGSYIFLDNFLGELEFAVNIDNLDFRAKEKSEKELIPIEKLKNYLRWRQKEFIEKYEGIKHRTDDDLRTIFEAESENENKLIAVINTDILNWEMKASHPWMMKIQISYHDNDLSGMPSKSTAEEMDKFEDDLMLLLKDSDGYINVGRETGNNERIIYFACKEFRNASRVLDKKIKITKQEMLIDFNIYKDKYWRTFNRYRK